MENFTFCTFRHNSLQLLPLSSKIGKSGTEKYAERPVLCRWDKITYMMVCSNTFGRLYRFAFCKRDDITFA